MKNIFQKSKNIIKTFIYAYMTEALIVRIDLAVKKFLKNIDKFI